MARSLGDYYNIVFWLNYSIYMVYFVLKYFAASVLWIVLEKANTANKDSKLAKFAKITIPMRALILSLFGGPLGIVQRRGDVYKADLQDDNEVPILYIRNERISYGATMVLSIIIVTFGIATLSTAIDLSFLRVTRLCNDDPFIDCYPQLSSDANQTIVEMLNITINIDEPIEDCAFWNSKGVSSQVSIVCFHFVTDVTTFLATIGGLLTIFTITMKVSTAVLLWLNATCNCFKARGEHTIRAVLAVAGALIEVGIAVVCLFLGTMGILSDAEDNPPWLRFIAMDGSKVLIAFGVVATLLWLPWETYVQIPKIREPDGIEMKAVGSSKETQTQTQIQEPDEVQMEAVGSSKEIQTQV